MVYEFGSKEIHDRYVQLGCDTVGLLANSHRWCNDASLLGIFYESFLPIFYRSSRDGSSWTTGTTTMANADIVGEIMD